MKSGDSPAHPWRLVAEVAAITAVICASLMAWVDKPVALALAPYRTSGFVHAFDEITKLANSAIWYLVALGGMFLAWRQGRKDNSPAAQALAGQRFRAALYIIASMVTSGLLINAIKLIVGRSRPKLYVNERIDVWAPFAQALDDCSFPSGHAQSICAAMLALAWIYPRGRWLFFAIAVVVASSRVIVGAHYTSDVIAGAFFAFAVALPMRRWFERGGISVDLTKP